MAAAATDLLQEVGVPGTATTLSAPGYTIGNTSVTVGATANWPTATGVTFVIDRAEVVNGVEQRIEGTYCEFVGKVSSGTQITDVSKVFGTDQDYSAGALTRVYMPITGERENRIVEWGLTHADQDGTLKAGAVDNAAVLTSDVVETAKIKDTNVTTAKLADSAVTSAKAATGFAVQSVSTNFSAVATGTTTIPFDDTIPQNTEGNEFMTQVITPKSATNILVIETTFMLAHSSSTGNLMAALFQDSTANALAAVASYQTTASAPMMITLSHTMVAGTTSATTFRIRAGSSSAGTATFNGQGGVRFFGAITKSFIRVTEYKA